MVTLSQKRRITLIFLIIFALISLLLGVGSQSIQAQTSNSGPAILSISLGTSPSATLPPSPRPGATYYDVTVSIEVANFNLVDKVGQENAAGEGHIIYYTTAPPTFPSYFSAYSFEGSYSVGTTLTTFKWTQSRFTYDVYAAQLVNNDDTPLDPPVYAMIASNMAVPGKANDVPIISSIYLVTKASSTPPASPTQGLTYFDCSVRTTVSGFQFVNPGDNPENVAGEGHAIHTEWVDPIIYPEYYATLDGDYTYPTYTSGNLNYLNRVAGYQSFAVTLVNNNDTVLDSPVFAIIKTNIGPEISSSIPPSTTTAPATVPTTSVSPPPVTTTTSPSTTRTAPPPTAASPTTTRTSPPVSTTPPPSTNERTGGPVGR